MSEPTEQRQEYYDIDTDIMWREITLADVVLLNEIRQAKGLPVLVFVGREQGHDGGA